METSTALARLFLLFILLSIPRQTSTANISDGFAIELIRRDSHLLPFYNPNATLFERWKAVFDRSFSRLQYLNIATGTTKTLPQALQVPLTPTVGEYVMKLGIGTPPQTVFLNLDTGSDLLWVQCPPCKSCYAQDEPIFDSSKSSSFRNISCNAGLCIVLKSHGCQLGSCTYTHDYMDGSFSGGELALESFSTQPGGNDLLILYDVAFGCGHTNGGHFRKEESGVAGFNLAPTSFIGQLGERLQFQFSYCLIDHTNRQASSQMLLGYPAVLSGNATQLVDEDMYYLNLQDISIGSNRLGIPPETFRRVEGVGGVILDSGSAMTYLHGVAYVIVLRYLRGNVKLKEIQGLQGLLCYEGTGKDLSNGNIPDMTFHFDGLDMPMKPQNSFVQVRWGVICLAMNGSTSLSIIGNLAQQNMQVGFDTFRKKVYMAPADCANDWTNAEK